MTKRSLFFVFKIAVTLALLTLLVSAVDVQELGLQMARVGVLPMVVAAACFFLALFINTVRWEQLLALQQVRVPLFHLLSYNLSYVFYLLVLPGGRAAAEVIRVYQIAKDLSSERDVRDRAALSAVADRVVALLSFFVVAAVVVSYPSTLSAELPPWLPAFTALGVVCGAIGVFTPYFDKILHAAARAVGPKVNERADFFLHALSQYRAKPLTLVWGLLLAVVADAALALGAYAISSSLGLNTPFIVIFAFYACGMIISLLPLTIGGIGVREGTFTYLLTLTGVSPEAALSVSLLTFAASLVAALGGGVVEFKRHFMRV